MNTLTARMLLVMLFVGILASTTACSKAEDQKVEATEAVGDEVSDSQQKSDAARKGASDDAGDNGECRDSAIHGPQHGIPQIVGFTSIIEAPPSSPAGAPSSAG